MRLLFLRLAAVFSLLGGLSFAAGTPPSPPPAASGRVVPPNPFGPFSCIDQTHESRVIFTIPSFPIYGSFCLTVAISRCVFLRGLAVSMPNTLPPNGVTPRIRFLVGDSLFNSGGSASAFDVYFRDLGTNSIRYSIEFVAANATVRAETTGSTTAYALRLGLGRSIRPNVTIFSCDLFASNSGTGSVTTALEFYSSPFTDATIRIMNSNMTAVGNRETSGIRFYTGIIVSSSVDITACRIRAEAGASQGIANGIQFYSAAPQNGTLFRLFGVDASATAPTGGRANAIFMARGRFTAATIRVHGGTFSATSQSGASFALLFDNGEVTNGTVSAYGASFLSTVQSANANRAAVVGVRATNSASLVIELIGGHAAALQRGTADAALWLIDNDANFTTNNGDMSALRTNGTAVSCESTWAMAGLLMVASNWRSLMEGLTVAVYGTGDGAAPVTLKAKTQVRLWSAVGNVYGIFFAAGTMLVLSRTSVAVAAPSFAVLHVTSTFISADTSLYWDYSSFALNDGPQQQLSPTYTCEGDPCPHLRVRIDDAGTPLMPSMCPHCLAPYGAPVPFDDGSDADYSVPGVGCFPWMPTLSRELTPTPSHPLSHSEAASLSVTATVAKYASQSLSFDLTSSPSVTHNPPPESSSHGATESRADGHASSATTTEAVHRHNTATTTSNASLTFARSPSPQLAASLSATQHDEMIPTTTATNGNSHSLHLAGTGSLTCTHMQAENLPPNTLTPTNALRSASTSIADRSPFIPNPLTRSALLPTHSPSISSILPKCRKAPKPKPLR